MKKLFFLFVLLMSSLTIGAQTYTIDLDATVLKNYKIFKKGTKVHLISMTHDCVQIATTTDGNAKYSEIYKLKTDQGEVDVKEKLAQVLDIDCKNAQDFWNAQIIFNVLETLSEKGTQEDLRADMEYDALKYIASAQSKGLEFNDPFLNTYIYSIISKLAPYEIIDGRPGSVNLLILSDPTANASMFPNGTLTITTGLISILHTEDELAAVLAHEIAHFILDHSVHNYNKAVARKKRAEFWAGLATVVTAAAETAATIHNPYYIPGAATAAVAAASTEIAIAVCERLGMKYSASQEEEADAMAVKLLELLKYNPNALCTALSRIEETMKEERSKRMFFASDHPSLVRRISATGTPYKDVDKSFEKTISFAVADAGMMKMQDRRYRQAMRLFAQNVNNNVATDDDYIQLANCLLNTQNSVKTNNEAIEYINKAKQISPNNINIYKAEIIATLRIKDYSSARDLLKEYIEKLQSMKEDKTLPDSIRESTFRFVQYELDWARDMSVKLSAF